MKTKTKPTNRGFAIVAVLFMIAVISTFLAMLMYSSSQRVHTATLLNNKIKAKAMAEAGCEYGYAVLSTNWEARLDPSAFASADGQTVSLQSYEFTAANGETYHITVEPIGLGAAVVTATGTCGQASADAAIGVQDLGGASYGGTPYDTTAFSYAIVSGGSFDFSGCGTISSPGGQSLFHSNGSMDIRGNTHPEVSVSSSTAISSGKVTINGNVTAPSIDLHKQATVLGAKTVAPVPTVPIPDIDLTPYYNWALAHGEVYNGFTTTTDVSPNGGILWVNGDFHASSHAVIRGSVIATGSIHISGQVDIMPTISAFCIASRDGDLHVTSSGTLSGLLYAKTGGLQHTANGEIRGQIIVNGDIKKAGNSDIMTVFMPRMPSPPAGMPTSRMIGIAAWQK